MADQQSTREFAHHKDTKAPEGATAGATTGGVIGGTLGVLAGIGSLAIPGLGPLLAAGPIVAGLAGLGAGGAVGRAHRRARRSRHCPAASDRATYRLGGHELIE